MKINTGILAHKIREEIDFMKGVPACEGGTFVAFADPTLQIHITVTRNEDDFMDVGKDQEDFVIADPRTPLPPESDPGYDLVQHLVRQIAFSAQAFGPGKRTSGILDHLRKELIEVRNAVIEQDDPDKFHLGELEEWIDLVLLSLDGAWRCAAAPMRVSPELVVTDQHEEIMTPSDVADTVCRELIKKLVKNENRQWPDWRTAEPGKAIEHVRGEP